jgi:hypothetical protein
MRISFKYAILAPIIGGIVMIGIIVGGGAVAGAIAWASKSPVPAEADVCAHLKGLGADVPECVGWLEASKEAYGDHYDNRLRCYAAAADVDGVRRCDEPIVYMSDEWDG